MPALKNAKVFIENRTHLTQSLYIISLGTAKVKGFLKKTDDFLKIKR